ncbi:glycosyltransferase family 2 protein [Agrobacterium vitis]|uniref:glycosyltransferase family 2 protein n=1 Tax=Agrobacterium vitis TaxID=373 RepID=UPI0012E888E8|nr:glycosyltransferase [Agrobacterium vitis]MVA22573.1 glycosyltransferase [Agrobacterium vitis]
MKKIGFIEKIDGGTVWGWSLGVKGARSSSIKVYIDGSYADEIVCDIMREDVNSYHNINIPTGFSYSVPNSYRDGQPHKIEIKSDTGVSLKSLIPNQSGSQIVFNAPSRFSGHVDKVSAGTVSGWVLENIDGRPLKKGGVTLAIYCNSSLVGQVIANQRRPDVAHILNGDTECGFSYPLPPFFLQQDVRIEVKTVSDGWPLTNSPITYTSLSNDDGALIGLIHKALDKNIADLWQLNLKIAEHTENSYISLDSYNDWAVEYFDDLNRRVPEIKSANIPLVSVICPVYRPRYRDFKMAVESVLGQTYKNIELVLVDDASNDPELDIILDEFARRDARVKLIKSTKNLNISEATNVAIANCSGDLIAFFDHDDLLEFCAIQFMVDALVANDALLVYSDEDKIDDAGYFSEPNLKSDWNLRLLMAQNYVCHFLIVSAEMVRKAGKLHTKYNGAQDHDFVLRLSEIIPENRIYHIPEILYHWRKTPNSTASTIDNKEYAIKAGIAAVQAYVDRNSIAASVTSRGNMTNYVVNYKEKSAKISIIIPFKDQIDMTRKCVYSILQNTDYKNFEIILVNNFSLSIEADSFRDEIEKLDNVRMMDANFAFNYSRINNFAAQNLKADAFLFMNNDVIVSDPTWLTELVGELLRSGDIGAVGCKLLYENGTVQHAGIIVGVNGGIADHPYKGHEAHDPGFMGRGLCSQELSAVTGACLLCSSDVFHAVSGFDELNFGVAFNDVDLCLKIRNLGKKVIWRAETVLEHRESLSRSSDLEPQKIARFAKEHVAFKEKWQVVLDNDPYYNPKFSRRTGIFKALKRV